MPSTPSTSTDAELVAGHLTGDRSALATIYDRYANTLYDTAAAMTRDRNDAADVLQDVFVIAAERLGQLRDPTRLKPWLFAILRNEVYRRTGRKRRTVATDFSDPVVEMTAPTQPADEGTNVEYEELADLVRGAAAGLDARDQLVLELSVRQGLQGDDLADALGVSSQQCYGLVHRMRQRTERSLGAYCVARAGRKDCPELAEILRGWDGEFSVLIRKRVARHVDGCDTCDRSRKKAAPFALFGAAPVMAAPAGLRDRVLGAAGTTGIAAPSYTFEAPGGFPTIARVGRRLGLWLFLTGSLMFLGLGAGLYVLTDGPTSSVAIDAAAVDQGESAAGPTTTTTIAVTTTAIAGAGGADGGFLVAGTGDPPDGVTGEPTTTTTTLDPATTTSPETTAGGPTTSVATVTTTSTVTTTAATTTSTTTTSTTTTTTRPGRLLLTAGTVDFGKTIDAASIVLSNLGDAPAGWSVAAPVGLRIVDSPYSVFPTSGTLAGGESVKITVNIDRKWPIEGPVPATVVTFAAEGTSASVELFGEIARPPGFGTPDLPIKQTCNIDSVSTPTMASIGVEVLDESPPVTGKFALTSPAGVTVAVRTTVNGGFHAASLILDRDGDGKIEDGLWTWTLIAVDTFGNGAELNGTIEVLLC